MKYLLSVATVAIALCTATPSIAQPLSAWDSAINVTAADGTLTKSGGCDLCADAGAHSRGQITGDGFGEFVVGAVSRLTAGLSSDLSSSTAEGSMDYAVSLSATGAYDIRERGVVVYRPRGSYAAGDRFRVGVEAGVVVYRRNGVPLYTSAVIPTVPLVLDVTLSSRGASISRAIVAARTLPVWDDIVKAAASSGDLIKNGGCGDCANAGGHTGRLLGNGIVEFTPAFGHRITAGLSTDLSASTDTANMEFAFSIWPSGTFEIRERGSYRSEGMLKPGDRLRIAVDGQTITYSRNGAVLYTSTAVPSFPMTLDATLTTRGAAIYEAAMAAAAATSTRTPVSWESPVNVTASTGTLTKSSGCADCMDAGAHSVTRLSGDGYAEFTAGSGVVTAGLSTDLTAATTMMTTNYAFTLQPTGSWEIRELGLYRGDGTYATGDRFRVAVEGGKVVYRRNGAPVYISATAPASPMVFDVALSTLGATLNGAVFGTGPSEYPPATATTTGTTSTTTTTTSTVVWPTGVVTAGPYTAIIDRQPYAKPAAPAIGPAGSTIVDPVFLSKITRVTDGNTRPAYLNSSYRTPSSTHLNAWSAAGTYFYVVSGGGASIPFRFDPATGTAKRVNATAGGDGGLVLNFYMEPQFSSVSDSIIYGSVGGVSGATYRSVDQYDFSTNTYTRLLDLDTLAPGLAGTYVGGIASSAGSTERIMAFFGGTAQDLHHLVVVFDKANPQNRLVLDTIANTLNGQPISFPLSISLHHAAIDRSGRYVMLYSTWTDQTSTRKAAQSYLWDTQTGGITELNVSALPYGHDAFGFGVSVNMDCCTSTTWDAAQWQFRSLASPLVTRDVIKTVLSPKEIYLADHPTWNNARPDALVPFVSGLFRAPSSTAVWRAWDDEIVAVQTDAAADAEGIVWRFAHHHTDVRNETDPTVISFWYTPRPNVSPDGRWVLFTSNWEKTLGTDPTADASATARQDVFLVALKK